MRAHTTTILVLFSASFVFSLGCGRTGSRAPDHKPVTFSFPPSESQTVPDDSTALSLDSLRNALVSTTDYGSVRLKNGEYIVDVEDSLKLYISLVDSFINVDLDGDGYKDAIGCLSINTGGSGCFNSLDIFLNRHGSAFHAASYEIGDREGFDSLKVAGDTLDVFFKIHGPNDPMC